MHKPSKTVKVHTVTFTFKKSKRPCENEILLGDTLQEIIRRTNEEVSELLKLPRTHRRGA